MHYSAAEDPRVADRVMPTSKKTTQRIGMEQEEQEADFQTLRDLSPPECLVNFTLSGTSPTTPPMGLLCLSGKERLLLLTLSKPRIKLESTARCIMCDCSLSLRDPPVSCSSHQRHFYLPPINTTDRLRMYLSCGSAVESSQVKCQDSGYLDWAQSCTARSHGVSKARL